MYGYFERRGKLVAYFRSEWRVYSAFCIGRQPSKRSSVALVIFKNVSHTSSTNSNLNAAKMKRSNVGSCYDGENSIPRKNRLIGFHEKMDSKDSKKKWTHRCVKRSNAIAPRLYLGKSGIQQCE